jgi:GRIM-19 protein
MSRLPLQDVDVLSKEFKDQIRRSPIDTRKYTTMRTPSGFLLFAVGAAAVFGGLYVMGQGNRRRHAVKDEEREIRGDLIPLLQHEQDVKLLQYMQTRYLIESVLIDEVLRGKSEQEIANLTKPVPYAPNWTIRDPVYYTRFCPPVDTETK